MLVRLIFIKGVLTNCEKWCSILLEGNMNTSKEKVMPTFTTDSLLRKVRQNKYIDKGLALYQNIEKLTPNSYALIKQKFDAGDRNQLYRLAELSIYSTIRAVARIYARYDIEEVLSFDEALSFSIECFCDNVLKFETLPEFFCSYEKSLTNHLVFKFIVGHYLDALSRQRVVSTKSRNEIIWDIDHKECDTFSYKNLNTDDFRTKLNKVFRKCTSKQVEVVKMRFGFNGEEMTFREISNKMNVSRSRAEEIVNQAIYNIRKNVLPINQYSNCDLEI